MTSTGHKQRYIPIKYAPVDVSIAPIVLWLNSFDAVYTLFSCEGDTNHKPYIMFFCRTQETLFKIIVELNYNAKIETFIDTNSTTVLYVARFISFNAMLNVCNTRKKIEELKKEDERLLRELKDEASKPV